MSFDDLNKEDLGYNGFTDFEQGAQSRQAEIDELQKRIDKAISAVMDYKCSHTVIDILKGLI